MLPRRRFRDKKIDLSIVNPFERILFSFVFNIQAFFLFFFSSYAETLQTLKL